MIAAPRECPACGALPRPGLRLDRDVQLLACPRCRLAWWPWPAFDAATFYDRDYFDSPDARKGYSNYSAMEPALRQTARTRLRRLARLGAVGGRLLELGCGTGVFLDEARKAGWSCAGVEVSGWAAERAAARGLNVRCASVEAVEIEARAWDAVCMWDVVEHLRDPASAIRAAGRGLCPGGLLALSTGDVTSLCARLSGRSWHLYNLPEHLFFFSPESLRRLMRASGCRVERVVREVNWIPISYAMERLAKPLGARPPRLPLIAASAVLPATLLDVLGVYARRA